jgi:hypothetical protein
MSRARRARTSSWIRNATVGAGLVLALAASAQAPIVYPAKGQSPEQQAKDKGECQVWATQNTGVDPAALAAAPAARAPSSVGGGERVGGAARGAAGGAAIGAIAGDAGEGAAIGAIAGTMMGGRRARQAQAGAVESSQAQKQQQIQTYYRAVSACLTARGYTVQ